MGVGRPFILSTPFKKNTDFDPGLVHAFLLFAHHMPSQGSGQVSSTLSLYSPKVPRLTLRCRVYLALPAEQAAEGKQAQ